MELRDGCFLILRIHSMYKYFCLNAKRRKESGEVKTTGEGRINNAATSRGIN